MSTISTTIQMNDMMSRQFGAINLAMATVIDSFQALESASEGAIDIAALNAAQRELQEVEAQFRSIEQEIHQANAAQNKLNNEIREGSTAADNLLGTLGTIAGTYLTLQGLGTTLAISDEMANTTARLDLINDGLQTTEQLQQMIFDSAQRSRGAYADTASMIAKLAMNAGDAFGSSKETIAFAELLNKQFVIAGTNVEGIESTILQLTQAMGSGVLRGEELNAVFEATPNVIQAIADYLDVSIGQIREMASNGEITADIVKAAMFEAADDINQKFESMPQTWSQVWTTFKNEALWAFQEVLTEINDIANSEGFKAFATDAKEALYTLADITMWALQTMSGMANFIYENWSLIAPVVGTATAALTFYALALGLVKAAEMAAVFWTGAKTLALGLATATSWANVQATLALTGAQWGLNAALYANPIFWVVAIIILLIGVIYGAVAAYNALTGSSVSATGIIMGAMATLGAFIANVLFGIAEITFGIVEALVNRWIAFANFFANVFNDPVAAVIHLFGDLADNVLGVIEKIAAAIDYVFGSNLAAAVSGWRNDLAGLVNFAADKYGNGQYEKLFQELDINSVLSELGIKAERFSYSDAWSAGNDFGSNLASGYEMPEQNTSWKDDFQNIADAINVGNAAAEDTAGNTKKLADSVDMLEDDIKYLRDAASAESINRFLSQEINVNMKNENYINNDNDIDGIIDKLVDKLEEAVETTGEGV